MLALWLKLGWMIFDRASEVAFFNQDGQQAGAARTGQREGERLQSIQLDDLIAPV